MLVLPGLPFPLTWEVEPASWTLDGDLLQVATHAGTDYFLDPAGAIAAPAAARALAPAPAGSWQLSARVAVDFRATYDAGVLLLWSGERHWAKLCFERSPQGSAMVVSVVTRELSDDANAWVVGAGPVWLRVSRTEPDTYAFHASADGRRWELVRYFALSGPAPVRLGVSAQSPTGDGCTATFDDLTFTAARLPDLRDGS